MTTKERREKKQLHPGEQLLHRQNGRTLARCTYRGAGEFRYHGRSFTSISAAANAAAEDLGMKSRTLNGWLFWGVEKRAAKKAVH